jgi:hypothetical protein
MPKVPKIEIGQIPSKNPKSEIPNPKSRWFAYEFIEHGLRIRCRAGAGTVAAYMGRGFTFNDLQPVGVSGKFV